MNILNNFDTKANFWKTNPQLCITEPLKSFYEADKSKDKTESSTIMWALVLVVDMDSKYFNLPILERRKIIARDYIKNKDFDFDKYKEYSDFYEKLSVTPAKRQLIEWSRIMDEKSEVLRSMKYNVTNWETIEKMLISNKTLFSEFERLSELLVREGEQGVVKGGSEESASEKGEV